MRCLFLLRYRGNTEQTEITEQTQTPIVASISSAISVCSIFSLLHFFGCGFAVLGFVPLTSQAQPGVITGRVITDDGTGLPGVRISLVPIAADRRAMTGDSTGTDGDGNFKFTELAPRVYSVSASSAKGYVPRPVSVGERQDGGLHHVGDN